MLSDHIIHGYKLLEDREPVEPVVLDRSPDLDSGDCSPDPALFNANPRRGGNGRKVVRAALYAMILLACSASSYLWGSKRTEKRDAAHLVEVLSANDVAFHEWHLKEQDKTVNAALRMVAERDFYIDKAIAEIKRLQAQIQWLDDQRKA